MKTVPIKPDHTIDQDWAAYRPGQHDVWQRLARRQTALLPGRAAPAFLRGLDRLAPFDEGIPDFERLNEVLDRATGWRIVAVPGLVPDDVFFEHLANRRFPAARFIRQPDELDYLEEPDIFHDVFGHVPLLVDPVFADYMQAYGEGGLRALNRGVLQHLARIYWYTVEFGLMQTEAGLRIYGAGIVSSAGETRFSVESASPNRIRFDLMRILRTRYRIDDYQESYFVIRNFKELFALAETDFGPLYDVLGDIDDLEPGTLTPNDEIVTRGTGSYHAARTHAA
jgi:phenylalanine-4-hydroxylase